MTGQRDEGALPGLRDHEARSRAALTAGAQSMEFPSAD